MFPYLQEPSVHESFSLMLMERIEKLEKENQTLFQEIKDIKNNMEEYQKYHCFKFTTSFHSNYIANVEYTVKTYINDIMKERIKFIPLFMMWNYNIIDIFDMITESDQDKIDNRYYIHLSIYVLIEKPLSIMEWKLLITSPKVNIEILKGGLFEMKTLIQEIIGYQVLLPYLNENDRIEIWIKGGLIEYELDPIMNIDLFTKSSNYIKSTELQEEYFRIVKSRNWSELFGIYQRF